MRNRYVNTDTYESQFTMQHFHEECIKHLNVVFISNLPMHFLHERKYTKV